MFSRFFIIFLLTFSIYLEAYSQEKITLRVSILDFNPSWVSEFFERFEQKHPNIKLKIQSESWSNYYTKLKMQLITNTAPDVMMFNASMLPPYSEQNKLLELSQYIEKDNFDLEKLFPSSVESCRWKSKIYGLPFSNDVSALFLNIDYFIKYNIDIPTNDSAMTWKSFEVLCKKLSDNVKKDEEESIDYVYIENMGWRALYSAVLQNDAKPFNRLEDPTKCLLDTPESLEACNYYFNFSLKYGYSPTMLEYRSVLLNSPSTLFIQGKLPIYLGRAGYTFLTDHDLKFKFKVIPCPRGKKRVTFIEVVAFAINAQTTHPYESWLLLKYIVSSDAQKLIATGKSFGRRIPSLMEIAYSEYFLPEIPDVRKVYLDELKYSIPLVKTNKASELGSVSDPVLERLAMKKISIEEAMKEITFKANKILSEKQ